MNMAEIGIIGGSGLYQFISKGRELTVQTPYGPASDVLSVGEIAGRACAFLPRHGRRHHLPPHQVPYRANIYALKELGVTQIIATSAVGALTTKHAVGQFVFADQLVDLTSGRESTFYDGPITTHVGFSDPYCPAMRKAAMAAAARLGLPCSDSATIVVVNGPRFSTRAESRHYAAQGWHLENMTQMPEAALARELTLSYLNVSLVTNSHAGSSESGQGEAVDAPTVIRALGEHVDDLRRLITAIVEELPPGNERPAEIRDALKNARWV